MKKINLYTSSEYYQSKKKYSAMIIKWTTVVTLVSFLFVFVILALEKQSQSSFDSKSAEVRNLRQLIKGDENIEKKYNQLAGLYEYFSLISNKSYQWSKNLNSLLFFSADAKIESISLDESSAFAVKLISENQDDLKRLSDRLETLGTDIDGVKKLVMTDGKISEATGGAVLSVRGLLNLKSK